MKKKILSFVLAICLIIPAIMFVGCGTPPGEEWEDIKQFSCTRPYHMQKGSETFTRVGIDFTGEMIQASITFNASDFTIKTNSKNYQAFAFADFDLSTREWSISYQSKTYNGEEGVAFEETGAYEYFNVSFDILIRGTELQENDVATLYYKGEAVCDL
ncbi:MAG: hypothetical protein IKC49_02765 [Clostridia bacterium]|nr:hypothetical protein [Clostridia bacterium]